LNIPQCRDCLGLERADQAKPAPDKQEKPSKSSGNFITFNGEFAICQCRHQNGTKIICSACVQARLLGLRVKGSEEEKQRNDARQPLVILEKAVERHGVRQVARMIDISKTNVTRWIHKRNIPIKRQKSILSLENMV
jgi:hypothetical protein